jgi:hypothetical protein
MPLVAKSPKFANRSVGAVVAAYDWLGAELGIDGRLDVDSLDEPTLRRALALIHNRHIKASLSSVLAPEFDAWLQGYGRSREDFALTTGRDPRAVATWKDHIPKWAEVVMDVLDALPDLWTLKLGRSYPGSPAEFRDRLAACRLSQSGVGVAQFSRLTGLRDETVRLWITKQPPAGWVEIVLRGLEAGVIGGDT